MADFVVIYRNTNVLGSGLDTEARVTVPVDFGVEVTAETLEERVEQLDAYAAEIWDEVDWTLDDPGWELVAVELPSGEVVEL